MLPFDKIEKDFTQNFNECYTGFHILGFREGKVSDFLSISKGYSFQKQ